MNEKDDAIQEAQGLMEMYSVGYLDGYARGAQIGKHRRDKVYTRIRPMIIESFEKRFKKKVIKEIDRLKGGAK